MTAIDAAIPNPGQADQIKLHAIDPETVARYVIDVAQPWWRRRPCAQSLSGRVPAACVDALCDRLRDPDEITEVRIELLHVLGDRPELLPWLQAQGQDQRFGVYDQIVATRARVGDLTAAPALAALAGSLWPIRIELGERGLDRLIAHHGAAAVEGAVGQDTPEGRTFLNRLRGREHADLTAALADPDVGVARRAAELIVNLGVPDTDHLLDHVITGPTIEARLWAAYVLHRRGRDIRELWQALDAPRVEVPGLPSEARFAIIREYAGETYCDPRWIVEEVCVTLPEPPDEEAHVARAIAALVEADLAPGKPQTAAQSQGVGAGTYYEIETIRGVVLISTLGAFATGGNNEVSNPTTARQALEAAGFRWIDDELGALVVPGLPVYYFGNRDPLDVRTLLFYWQD